MKTLLREKEGGVEYYRESYMHGGGWHSLERNVLPGTVRLINGILSFAWTINKRGVFRRPEVHWCAVRPECLRDVPINEKP